MSRPEWWLRLLLRAVGVACLFAIPAVFMPRSWMAVIHEWSGLGKFPDGLVVEYLARAVSAFYAMFGGLLLFAASDTRRYAAIITYCAWLGVVYGGTMATINAVIGMPLAWVLGEGLTAVPTGVVLLLLQRAASAPERPKEVQDEERLVLCLRCAHGRRARRLRR